MVNEEVGRWKTEDGRRKMEDGRWKVEDSRSLHFDFAIIERSRNAVTKRIRSDVLSLSKYGGMAK